MAADQLAERALVAARDPGHERLVGLVIHRFGNAIIGIETVDCNDCLDQ
jgi:hypothetical protein